MLAACPHMDDLFQNIDKLTEIIKVAKPKSLTVVYTEAECCYGMVAGVNQAVEESGKSIPVTVRKVSIRNDWLIK